MIIPTLSPESTTTSEFLTLANQHGVNLDLFGDFQPEIQYKEENPDPTKPTIAYIHTGGTLAMVASQENKNTLSFEGAIDLRQTIDLCDSITQIKEKYNILGVFLCNMDSKEVGPDLWTALAATIRTIYENVEGIVVGHGTHTLEYSAAAISYALRNIAIPIVFTASQMPIVGQPGSDGLGNLTGAMKIAAEGNLGEVVAYALGEIHRGTRVRKENDKRLNVFASPVTGPIGYLTAAGVEVRFGVRPRGFKRKHELIFQPRFSKSVSTLRLNPGEVHHSIDQLMTQKERLGIILESYGSGAIPIDWIPSLGRHVQEGFPIFLSSTCGQSGSSQGMEDHDEDSILVRKAGILTVGDMTTPAACVKLMSVMADVGSMQNKAERLKFIQQEMLEKNYAGEITMKNQQADF